MTRRTPIGYRPHFPKEGTFMAYYMLQGAYSSEAWAAQLKDPKNRVEAVRPAFEKLGGKIEQSFYTFGEYDILVIAQFPDSVSAAAISIAIAGGGAFKSAKTTPLLSIDEGLQALKKAGTSGYRPPAG
ncbi:MAG TPA: GYD domain-containing protein [Vicinamibacteria bacterium]|nr:GYD domain-containing protein [Vicinamibacteria bacterium]